jgi:hypothetical protein
MARVQLTSLASTASAITNQAAVFSNNVPGDDLPPITPAI